MESIVQIKPLKGFNAFGDVHKMGKKVHTDDCTLIFVSNHSSELQLIQYGISVPKRNCKKAVIRNRIKRLLRESLRQLAGDLQKMNIESILIYWRKVPTSPKLISLDTVLTSLKYALNKLDKKNHN